MRKILITLLLLLAAQQVAQAQIGQVAPMRGKVSDSYNFWLYAPNEYYEYPEDLFPVVIFLHGRSLCGNDMNRSRKYGVLNAISMGLKVEALVINPQNPGGSWNPEKINRILEWVLENYRADRYKVYVIGMSLGGYGTMDFVGTYPEKVAAAMALCGGTTLKDVQGMGELPFWIMHGTADRAVSISESKKVVADLKAEGNDKLLRYDWVPGASHGKLASVFYVKKVYDWFFQHDKLRNPDEVNRDIDITISDMNNCYNDLNTRGGNIKEVRDLER